MSTGLGAMEIVLICIVGLCCLSLLAAVIGATIWFATRHRKETLPVHREPEQ